MNNHQIPRAVKWFVSSPQYTLLKTWGSSIYQEEEGIEAFVSLFPDRYSADVLAENSKRYNLENAYSCVKDYFSRQWKCFRPGAIRQYKLSDFRFHR